MAGKSGSTKSGTPVPAREQLDQQKAGPEGDREKALKSDAREQEKVQRGELAAGKVSGAAAKAGRD